MGKSKNKKKAKEQKATEAYSPTGEAAKSRMETSETAQPVSYAAVAADPPAEENRVTNNSTNAPAITVDETASDSTSLSGKPAPTSLAPKIFEDDAVDVAFLSPPELKRKKEADGTDSDFSLLKKDEISNAGSPGQLLNTEPRSEDASKENPATEGEELGGNGEKSDDSTSKAKTTENETGEEAKATSHSSMRRALPFQKTSSSLVRSISKADCDKIFDSETKDGNDVDAAEASIQEDTTDSTPIHPAVKVSLHVKPILASGTNKFSKENHRLAQALEDLEAALYESTVLLQDATDELEATKRERAGLEEDRDRFKKELDETRETLQSVHERRQRLQDEKDKHKIREADWEKEKERFEARIDQLTKARPAEPGNEGPSTTPPKIDESSRSPPGDASKNTALKEEIQQLQKQLKDSQDELKKAQDELKIFRAYRKKQEDEHIYKAKIAACATENEKLQKFGGTLDSESRLYRTLKKLADYHDNRGPEPTSEEYAQMKEFKSCIDERRRIMFQARTHRDPRGFMKPNLDKWSEIARKGDCMFTFLTTCPDSQDAPFVGSHMEVPLTRS